MPDLFQFQVGAYLHFQVAEIISEARETIMTVDKQQDASEIRKQELKVWRDYATSLVI